MASETAAAQKATSRLVATEVRSERSSQAAPYQPRVQPVKSDVCLPRVPRLKE